MYLFAKRGVDERTLWYNYTLRVIWFMKGNMTCKPCSLFYRRTNRVARGIFIFASVFNFYFSITGNFEKNSEDSQQPVACITCTQSPCCTNWHGPNFDDWWLHNPEWIISTENDTGFCFSKISNKSQSDFLTRIYNLQWNKTNCSAIVQTHQVSSGFGASLMTVIKPFYFSFLAGRPFQMTKHWHGASSLFAATDNKSEFFCNTTDLGCYLLPWSPCAPDYGRNDPIRGAIQRHSEEFMWFKQYASRLKQNVRRQIVLTLSKYPKVELPCTAIHIRRGDSGLPRYPFRRYAAVSEYLEAGRVLENDTIVLLTDDASPIEEVNLFHPNYNWIYADRPRNNGSLAGFDSHIPSGDPVSDFFAIQAEIRLASRCSKFVYGKSGFVDIILDQMQAVGNHNVSRYYVNTAISQDEAQSIRGRNRGSVLIEQIFSDEAARQRGT